MNRVDINPDGAITYWATTDTNRQQLVDSIAAEEISPAVPNDRTAESCLKAALVAYCSEQRSSGCECTVISHADPSQEGFELHRIHKRSDRNEIEFIASVAVELVETVNGVEQATDASRIKVTDGYISERDLDSIQQAYTYERGTLTGAQVGNMLSKAVEAHDGVRLRPQGSVYWVPEASLPQWKKLARAVEAQGGNRVYFARTVLDASGIRAVRDAIVAEAQAAVAELSEDIASNALGERAVENRKRTAQSLKQKVERYEAILGEALSEVKVAIDTAEDALATVVLADSGQKVEEFLLPQ